MSKSNQRQPTEEESREREASLTGPSSRTNTELSENVKCSENRGAGTESGKELSGQNDSAVAVSSRPESDPDQTRIREQLQMILVLVGFFILQTEAGGSSSS